MKHRRVKPTASSMPRETNGHSVDRKAAQLCQQVQRALEYAVPEVLSGGDLDASVLDVRPAPNTSHLLVLLQAIGPGGEELMGQLQKQIEKLSGVLRAEVARSINRRKAPTLSFLVVPSQGWYDSSH